MALMGIDETLKALVACVCTALEDSEAPVCICSTTVGNPMISTCCECDSGQSGELWGNFVRLYRGDRISGGEVQAQRPCAPANWVAQFQITLARCFPTIDESGEIPDSEDQAQAAQGIHADVAAIRRAIHCCQETEPATLEAINVQTDPTGGCSFLVATLNVPVSMRMSDNERP